MPIHSNFSSHESALYKRLRSLGCAGLILFTAACANTSSDSGAGESSVCDDVDLPACPEECPDDWATTCGETCEVDGEICGNQIGDGRECVDGMWQCSVHAPLGDADTCNLVCDPDE